MRSGKNVGSHSGRKGLDRGVACNSCSVGFYPRRRSTRGARTNHLRRAPSASRPLRAGHRRYRATTPRGLPLRYAATLVAPDRVPQRSGGRCGRRGAAAFGRATIIPGSPADLRAGRRARGGHVPSEPCRGARNRGQLHLGGGARGGPGWRDHPVLVRAKARHHHDESDRQGHEYQRADRARRRWAGEAERWGAAPDPLHGHLRSGAGVDDVALPGSSLPHAGHPEPDLRGRELKSSAVRLGGGGGAIFARGGRLRIVNSVFTGNRCERGWAGHRRRAVRALSQYRGLPVYVVGSRFAGNICSNGGALSSSASPGRAQ